MFSRADLSQEHSVIVDIAQAISAAIDDPAFNIVEVVRLRWRLSHTLAVHLAKEDTYLYPQLKQHRDVALARLATTFEREMGGLREGYRSYMAAWSGERIERERDRFVAETRDLLSLLGRRVEREEAELYPKCEAADI